MKAPSCHPTAPPGGFACRARAPTRNHPIGRRALLAWPAAALIAGPADARPDRELKLLALGDSLTAGYGVPTGQGFVPRLQAALRARDWRVRVIDAGVSGDTSAGGLARLDWALTERPDAVLLELGANDGLRGLPVPELRRNLTAILDRLSARNIPVLLSGMFAPRNYGEAYGRDFAAVYRDLGGRPNLIFDLFFLEGVVGDPALNQPDGIHPNAAGVDRIVARLLPVVEALLERVPA